MLLTKKIARHATSANPKKNPAVRRRRPTVSTAVAIPTFHLVPKRTVMGVVIPGRFVRFWGGRKPSKYTPTGKRVKGGAE